MTDSPLQSAIDQLSEFQKEAVAWKDGSLLVLAGPGSGKTQVLTCRIAKLLDESREKSFRILALTFTNKAADEMASRVSNFVPGLEHRATIGTFHSFCGQMLRQHGVHIGIEPDFTIYSLDDDRKAIFEDALRRGVSEGKEVSMEDVAYLALIDKLKARLVRPENTVAALPKYPVSQRLAQVYALYEEELRKTNALDFNSLIFEAHRLATEFPMIAANYRRSYPYWLLDEYQDTNDAQYRLLRALAGNDFKNVFAVADDDQIIYQWNGASFKQIQRFNADFAASSIQLSTNHRCPPAIVEAANRLVAYNAQRTAAKRPLTPGKTNLQFPSEQHIQLRDFDTQQDEAEGIAAEIAKQDQVTWGGTCVLARNRALLEAVKSELDALSVPASIVQRRDDFLSAELRWMASLLRASTRPLDRRNFKVMIESFNRMVGTDVLLDQIYADAEASGEGYLVTWLRMLEGSQESLVTKWVPCVQNLVRDKGAYRGVIDQILATFKSELDNDAATDLLEDLTAWREISREIFRSVGAGAPLDQFLQELQLRSKEPSPRQQAVSLMTIHGSKGREFDFVYLVGLAEDIMPSYQSRQKGDSSAEMEEERRNCFVAITRTKECLVMSRARHYRGYFKSPSRFLVEMELVESDA